MKSGVELCKVDEKRLKEFGDLMRQIRSFDSLIGTTDVILLASSMIDQKCRAFLTFDNSMIESEGLRKLIDKHVSSKRRFRIRNAVRE